VTALRVRWERLQDWARDAIVSWLFAPIPGLDDEEPVGSNGKGVERVVVTVVGDLDDGDSAVVDLVHGTVESAPN